MVEGGPAIPVTSVEADRDVEMKDSTPEASVAAPVADANPADDHADSAQAGTSEDTVPSQDQDDAQAKSPTESESKTDLAPAAEQGGGHSEQNGTADARPEPTGNTEAMAAGEVDNSKEKSLDTVGDGATTDATAKQKAFEPAQDAVTTDGASKAETKTDESGEQPVLGTKRAREDDDVDSEPKVKPEAKPDDAPTANAPVVSDVSSVTKSETATPDARANGTTTVVNGSIDQVTAPKTPQLIYGGLKTGICYDVRMRYHSRINTSTYDYVDPHPEDPRRIYRIYKAFAEAGLLHDPSLQGHSELGPLMLKLPVREAREEELLLVHTREHLDFIASTEHMQREQLIAETEKGDSIYLNNDSYLAAKLSCGGSIEACRAVVERRVKNAVAVVRPPGHHAEPHTPGGFCLFSNVAVAAQTILREYPDSVRRVLVLDWDVHHGNGTQRAFLDDDRVLYVSLHRHEGGRFYPGTPFGGHTVVGEGRGAGYSVNIPWERAGMGDGDYIHAFHQIIMPIAFEFDPDLVIVSAGFDAAEGDVIGGCHVSPNCYAYMTHMLKSLASGHLVVVLEGGYNLSAIASSALAVTKVLVGDPPGPPRTKLPSASAIRVIDEVHKVQSRYWKCLRPAVPANEPTDLLDEENLTETIRGHQARQLQQKYGFAPLPVLKTSLIATSENQILASRDVHRREKLIVILHDTPEIWADRDPVTGTIRANESSVVDSAGMFVKWGVDHDFGIVDVNVPVDHSDGVAPAVAAQDLASYIWDNYIEYFDARNIVFVGIGEAYNGIVHLAGHRDIRERTDAIITFVGDFSLKALVPVIDEYVTDWFFRTSLVFTSTDHPCWDTSLNPKRPRRKFGRVLRADSRGLHEVVRERFTESIEFVEEMMEDEAAADQDGPVMVTAPDN